MSDVTAVVSASARKIESEILHRLARKTQAEVALAVDRDPAWVSRVGSGHGGVNLSQFGPFLEVLGLKVVPIDQPTIDPVEYEAIRALARKFLDIPLSGSKG